MKKSDEKFPNEFTLLLCTYKNDNPQHLKECLDSIIEGTIHPSELVIVKDGPLTTELDKVMSAVNFPFETKVVFLSSNQTLGIARSVGLMTAKHNWVAIMDSDDICFPKRFEIQIRYLSENPHVDILGGAIVEFDEFKENVVSERKVPVTHEEIANRMKIRNPFNSVTVMLRKDTAVAAGNFRKFHGFEDYDLWSRMLANGAKCANFEEPLVYVRVGNGMYGRRRGLNYVVSEWRMQKQLYSLGITRFIELVRNLVLRIPIRVLPENILKHLYLKLARQKPNYSHQEKE